MAKQFNQPLPKHSQFYGKELFAQDANRGLIWARFFEGYTSDFSGFLDIKEQTDRVTRTVTVEAQMGKSDFVKRFNGTLNFSDALATRTRSLVDSMGGSVACYQTQGRFVTGMGNDHPTENGFTWHPTLGVPYLPASSVKGLVRGWLEWQWGEEALKKDGDAQKRQQLLQWFGSEHKDPREQQFDQQAGWFIFFDALPTAPVQLAADVMTPHYGKWYENGGDEKENTKPETVPADWHSPIPVTFLTVKKATFQFGIAVRGGLKADDQTAAKTALHEVMAVLQDALEWAGAGAKTATGYGRMFESPGQAKQRERDKVEREARALRDAEELEKQRQLATENARLADMSSLDRKLEQELLKLEYKGQLPWQAWLNALKKPNLFEPSEGVELAQRIQAALEQDGKWKPEEKSKQGERCRTILAYLVA